MSSKINSNVIKVNMYSKLYIKSDEMSLILIFYIFLLNSSYNATQIISLILFP